MFSSFFKRVTSYDDDDDDPDDDDDVDAALADVADVAGVAGAPRETTAKQQTNRAGAQHKQTPHVFFPCCGRSRSEARSGEKR